MFPFSPSSRDRPGRRRPASGVAAAVLLAATAALVAAGPAAAQTGSSDSTATLTGRVMSAMTGGPLGQARVVMTGAGRRAVTDSSGAFRLADVPGGLDTVRVELLGFADQSVPLRLKPDAVTRVTFLLSRTVLKVEDIRVEVEENPLRNPLTEFERRKALGHGYFITPEDIEEQDPTHPSDLLRRVPGLSVEPFQPGNETAVRVVRAALNCRPTLYLNGNLWPRHHIDELDRNQILAVEVYRGAGEMPLRFQHGRSRCGAIVVWTRQGGGERR